MLKIEKKSENGTTQFALEGRLDTMSAPELEAALQEELPGTTELIMDFEKLSYISSAGLRVLLSAQKIMTKQGSMKIRHVNGEIMNIFDVTGFAEILTIE